MKRGGKLSADELAWLLDRARGKDGANAEQPSTEGEIREAENAPSVAADEPISAGANPDSNAVREAEAEDTAAQAEINAAEDLE